MLLRVLIFLSDISHIVMINPLVETLFDENDELWKNFWYKSIVPKWYSYAIGSVIGLNRFLLMANLLKPQISFDGLAENITNRQVRFDFF